MTYTTKSPAVKRAVDTYWGTPGNTPEGLAAVLTEHKRGLRERLAAAQRVNAALTALVERLAVLPEITDEDVEACRDAWRESIHWRDAVHRTLAAYRERLTAPLMPVPAEPVDLDAAAIAARAAEALAAIGEFPGLDITFDPDTDADHALCTQIARRTLAAYRAHVDKDES